MARTRPLNEEYDDPNGIEVFQDTNSKLFQSEVVDQFYQSDDGGANWQAIRLPGTGTLYSPWCKDSIGTQGYL